VDDVTLEKESFVCGLSSPEFHTHCGVPNHDVGGGLHVVSWSLHTRQGMGCGDARAVFPRHSIVGSADQQNRSFDRRGILVLSSLPGLELAVFSDPTGNSAVPEKLESV
jgi:hypothetical protein